MKGLLETLPQRFSALSPRTERALLVGWGVAVALVAVALLVLPGTTFIGKYSHDIMIFFDGADRVLEGQVPNRDFHNALGPLSVLLPALGLWLSGSLGGMFPWATAAFAAILAPVLIYVGASRLPLPYAAAFILWAMILVVAPLNPGEPVEAISFAMFYNRFGWALLGILLLLVLPRRNGSRRDLVDGLLLGALLALLFYLKATYAMVGLACTLLFFIFPHMRRAALIGLGSSLAAVGLVEIFWSGTGGYLADVRMAAEASGMVRGTLFTLSRLVLQNLMACLLFASILVVAFARGARWDFLLLSLLVGGAGILILNQNAQGSEILTFAPAALVAALAPRRNAAEASSWPGLGTNLMLLALAGPFVATSSVALAYHAVKASRGSPADARANLDGLIVRDRPYPGELLPLDELAEVYRRGSADVSVVNRLGVTGFPEGDRAYLHTLSEALDLLRRDPALKGSIFVADASNPLNALLDRKPPTGADVWLTGGRNISPTVYRPAEQVFADVDVILLPRHPRQLGTTLIVREVYRPYVLSHYRPVASTIFWDAWARRTPR